MWLGSSLLNKFSITTDTDNWIWCCIPLVSIPAVFSSILYESMNIHPPPAVPFFLVFPPVSKFEFVSASMDSNTDHFSLWKKKVSDHFCNIIHFSMCMPSVFQSYFHTKYVQMRNFQAFFLHNFYWEEKHL